MPSSCIRVPEQGDKALVEEACRFIEPVSHSKDGGAIYLPCVPSLPFKVDELRVKDSRTEIPASLLNPLLKCPDGEIEGLASGKRSAIF